MSTGGAPRAGVGGRRVGTILQLFPGEAMVKRKPGLNPAGDDREYFQLAIAAAQAADPRCR